MIVYALYNGEKVPDLIKLEIILINICLRIKSSSTDGICHLLTTFM